MHDPDTMRHALPHALMNRVSEFVATRLGLAFPQQRWKDLERGLAAAAPAFGAANAEACARELLSNPLTHDQVGRLASHLTVGETYFFREPRSFEAFEQHILPALLRSRAAGERRLRLWSAGCCTGEEPYSIAVLLDRLLPRDSEWRISLLATDLNPQFLHQAQTGLYGDWSFRGAPAWLQESYFQRKKDGRYEIQPHIRRRVEFAHLNLADDVYPSSVNHTQAMDVIFCRNVLMYFTEQQARKVIANFHRSLVNGGWLIVSPVETSTRLFSQFATLDYAGAVLYRKAEETGPAAQASVTAGVIDANAVEIREAAGADFAGHAAVPAFNGGERYAQRTLRFAPPAALISTTLAGNDHETAPAQTEAGAEEMAVMAQTCADQGRLAEAETWCRQAIATDKLNPAHHQLLAGILQELGQHEAAVRALMSALYLAPDCVSAHVALGNLCCAQGRRREAQRHFDHALALLRAHLPDAILPDSAGLTAGRLGEIVANIRSRLSGHEEQRR
ncbi:MAG: tetratricopeptide repeat protein [Methylococcaceae bacterium]|nr:MAG: tetratricopeptide repeat protein [Methylococcaceae bacterium]